MRRTPDSRFVALVVAVVAALGSGDAVSAQGIENDLRVAFKTEYRGVEDPGSVVGTVENSSRREYSCVRIEFALSTRFDRRQQGEARRELGGHVIAVEGVEALSTRSFKDDLPFPAAVRFASISECGHEAPTQRDTQAAGGSGTGASVVRRDHRQGTAGSMTAPVREEESEAGSENKRIQQMEEEAKKLEKQLKELEGGGEGSARRSSVVDHRGNAPAQGPAQRPTRTTDRASTDGLEEQPAEVAPSDQLIGEIRMFGGNYAPQGWALCDGRLLPINQHDALFSVLGTQYGGDGRNTFGLPDLRGQFGVTFIVSLEGRYPSRQ